jgi:hypothetical protein
MERHTLSKSTFIRGVQCLKSLYLYKKRYFLRDPLSAEQQAVFSRGTNVGILAQKLFPNGKDATPPSPSLYTRSIAMTSGWIQKGTEVIYEAAFQHEKVLVAIDLLVFTPEGWVGIEVKSSRVISETYIMDAALQYHVITGSGLKLADMRIMHINPDYVRQGELDLEKLFSIQSVLETVLEKQDFIHDQILREKEVIEMPHSPDISIGLHCHNPYTCDFVGHCWKNYPVPTVFDLNTFSPEEQQNLFDKGLHSLTELVNAPGLNAEQRIQINSHITGELFLDKEALSDFLKIPDEPTAFLKVLYFRPALPLFDGTKPYESLPFAFALLAKETGAEPEYFIIPPGRYPIEEFIKQIYSKIAGFMRIIVLGKSSELIEFIGEMNSRIEVLDLFEPFTKQMIYHPGFARGINLAEMTGANEFSNNSPMGNIQSETMAGVRYLALAHALEGEAYSQELENIKLFALQKVNEIALLFKWLQTKTNGSSG